jgi:hypothetical protein
MMSPASVIVPAPVTIGAPTAFPSPSRSAVMF